MKVISWNIGGGFISEDSHNSYSKEDLNYFINVLNEEQGDIICFQELHTSLDINQSEEIANRLNYYYNTVPFSDSHIKEKNKLNISILSKFEIISSNYIILPNVDFKFLLNGKKVSSHEKGIIEIIINYKNQNIRILNLQLQPFRKFKRNILEEDFSLLRDTVENYFLKSKLPTIICGDFNNESIKKVFPKLFNKYNYSLSFTESIITTPRKRSYDKIIYSKEFQLENFGIKETLADHHLCNSKLNLK